MNQILVRYGRGHRTLERGRQKFEQAGFPIHFVVIGLGVYGATVPDTEQARAIVKELGWTVCRKQWAHLKVSSDSE